MTWIIVIGLYILSVALNVWLNKKLVEIDNSYSFLSGLWVLSIVYSVAIIIVIVSEKDSKLPSIFTDEYWRNKLIK